MKFFSTYTFENIRSAKYSQHQVEDLIEIRKLQLDFA